MCGEDANSARRARWRSGLAVAGQTITPHRVRMGMPDGNGRTGGAWLMWVPAHGGGIAPNAYVDCIAKSCLAEEPDAEHELDLDRLCYYKVQPLVDGVPKGRAWRNLADMNVYRLMLSRIMAAEGARHRDVRTKKKGVDVFGCDPRRACYEWRWRWQCSTLERRGQSACDAE